MTETSKLYNVAQIELCYHRNDKPFDYPVVNNSLIAFQILRSAWNDNKIDLVEEFKIILLDRGKECLGVVHLSSGGFNDVSVDPKLVFGAALQGRASSIILAHNHTSNNLTPSTNDIEFTKHMITCSMVMDIDVDDHLIINRQRYHSMKDSYFML